jgi:heme exporter protein A
MIEVRGLVRSFGPTHALRGVDLDAADGESLTILGPNGAGKTTFLRILATLLKPTEGEVRINGTDLHSGTCEARRQLGFSSHDSLIYDDLSVEENLHFYGRLYGISKRKERVEEVLRLVGLRPRRHSRARTLSRGMQQRLSLARAILHEPPILLLDEPYSGLDQEAARMLEELLAAVRAETRTVVMTTHNLERGLSLSDRICILSKGRVVYEADSARLSLSELRVAYWEKTQEASSAAEGDSE